MAAARQGRVVGILCVALVVALVWVAAAQAGKAKTPPAIDHIRGTWLMTASGTEYNPSDGSSHKFSASFFWYITVTGSDTVHIEEVGEETCSYDAYYTNGFLLVGQSDDTDLPTSALTAFMAVKPGTAGALQMSGQFVNYQYEGGEDDRVESGKVSGKQQSLTVPP